MSAADTNYYQSWILCLTVPLDGPAAIHTFGGRGSPVL